LVELAALSGGLGDPRGGGRVGRFGGAAVGGRRFGNGGTLRRGRVGVVAAPRHCQGSGGQSRHPADGETSPRGFEPRSAGDAGHAIPFSTRLTSTTIAGESDVLRHTL